jgi:hypothetical protein
LLHVLTGIVIMPLLLHTVPSAESERFTYEKLF